MAKIIGLEEIQSGSHLQMELKQGGKFVVYEYCISILVMTFRRSSSIYFIRAGEGAVVKGIPFTWVVGHSVGADLYHYQRLDKF